MNYDDFICEQKFIHAVSCQTVIELCIIETLQPLTIQQYKIGPNDDLKAKKVHCVHLLHVHNI